MNLPPEWTLLNGGTLGLAQSRQLVGDGLVRRRQADLRGWLTWGALLGALLVLLPWRDALGWRA